ncbi:long-chain-fatty-acid--CoA ligase 6 [Caerostris extrusa]|uniref:long-chain-fatty-acid--CoA ligase n=1 Tax=Caerostris extrusa TaxID=172846 RepID=A0AAV4N220_CAEEX|nr:long-chain-fatty-acid--CoA ligase 6 [Caerostris extrusa]
MKPGQDSFIGIYSQNSVEWILTEHACYNQSAVIVPLYDTLGPNACSFIINQAEIKIVVCDKEEKVKSLLERKDDTPGLKNIVVINNVTDKIKEFASEKGVQLNTLKEIEEMGATKPCRNTASQTFRYCYSLLHKWNYWGEYAPNKTDIMMSFLPLAHMLERLCEVTVYINGGSLGFFGGDVRTLTDDLKALRPTIMPAVPRLLNRVYDKVIVKANGSMLSKLIFKLALKMKQSELQQLIIRNNSIWDRIVFKQVREGMGGRLRLLVSGSAPLAGNVLTFIRCALGCVVVEGYGQTECVAPCTLNIQGDFSVGHVGPPISCCHIKLVDVPEMEYYSKDGKGEVIKII